MPSPLGREIEQANSQLRIVQRSQGLSDTTIATMAMNLFFYRILTAFFLSTIKFQGFKHFGLVVVVLLGVTYGCGLIGSVYFPDDEFSNNGLLGVSVAPVVPWMMGLILVLTRGGGGRIVYAIAMVTLFALTPFIPIILAYWLSLKRADLSGDGWGNFHAFLTLSAMIGLVASSPLLLRFFNRLHCKPW